MRATILSLLLSSASLFALEPVSVSRATGDYRVTITLTDTEPRGIASIVIQHKRERVTLPASLYDDIRTPHLGAGFKAAEFRFEVKQSKAFIRVSAGATPGHDDHAWVLSLPLKDALRISRLGDVTGYTETRPSTPLFR